MYWHNARQCLNYLLLDRLSDDISKFIHNILLLIIDIYLNVTIFSIVIIYLFLFFNIIIRISILFLETFHI